MARGDVSMRCALVLLSVAGCRREDPANQLDARTELEPDAPTGTLDGAAVRPDAPTPTLACTVMVLGRPAEDAVESAVTDIDDAGNLAGAYRPRTVEYFRAFRWSAATGYVDLGSLGGIGAVARAISGDITVGESRTSPSEGRAFLTDVSGMHELPTLGGLGLDVGAAAGVNASGVAVGASRIASGFFHAAMYKDGTVVDLGSLSGVERSNSNAHAINDRGVIVGTSEGTAVMWVDGRIMPLGPGTATAVNEAGDAVGDLTLFRGGRTSPIDILPGFETGAAKGINDTGMIVGWMYHVRGIEISGVMHGFIHFDGVTYDLNDLLTERKELIETATAINNAGQIAANGPGGPMMVTCRPLAR